MERKILLLKINNLRASLDVKGKSGGRWLLLFPDLRWLHCPSVLQSSTMQHGTRPQRRLQGNGIDKIKTKDKKQTILLFSTFYPLNLLKIRLINHYNQNCNISPLFISSALRPSLSLHNLASVTFTEVFKRTIYQCHFILLLSSLLLSTCPALQPKKNGKSTTHYPTPFIPSPNSYPFIQTLPCCFKT